MKQGANNAPPGVVGAALDNELDFIKQQMEAMNDDGIGFHDDDAATVSGAPAYGVPGRVPGVEEVKDDASVFHDAVIDHIKLRGSDRESK